MRMFIINVRVLALLTVALYFLIPVINWISTSIQQVASTTDSRVHLPNYAQLEWATKHFREFAETRRDYVSFIGWRVKPYRGETINIEGEGPNRRTPRTSPHNPDRRVYFFGGSTMWGLGSDDARTIPAQFQAIAGGSVLNFGQPGWSAHQSLNQLMKLYTEGHRPDDVVFYDGVNEVHHKCRRENDFWAHDQQEQIRHALSRKPWEFAYYIQPVLTLAQVVAKAFRAKHGYDCEEQSVKTHLIAEQLLTDWKMAALIVGSNGGRFHAYLQPVSYLGRTRTEHLPSGTKFGLKEQFLAVYSLFQRKMAQYGMGTDLTAIFDRDEFIYIDHCHVSPNGNAIVAERIARDLGAAEK